MDKTMGDRIKQKRKELSLTQEDLGNKVGVQKSAVAKWENGRVDNLSTNRIKELADALKTTPVFLISGDVTFEMYGSDDTRVELTKTIKSDISKLSNEQLARLSNYINYLIIDAQLGKEKNEQ